MFQFQSHRNNKPILSCSYYSANKVFMLKLRLKGPSKLSSQAEFQPQPAPDDDTKVFRFLL